MALGKKTLYIMIPANILLWGYISYAICDYMHEPILEFNPSESISLQKLNQDTSNYKIKLDYPDPFLKEEAIKKPIKNYSKSNSSKDPITTQRAIPKPVMPVQLKEIKYFGLIQNKTNGTATALISINGTSYIIKKGEVIEGINFESITNESIIAKIGKEKLTISKS